MTQETGRDKADTTDLVDVAEEAAMAAERDGRRRGKRSGDGDGAEGGSGTGRGRSLWRGVRGILGIVVLVILVPTFVARVYAIPSGSMEATLHGCTGCTNDRVLVDKVSYRFTDPKPGDVVVFIRPTSWHNSELEDTPTPTGALGKSLLKFTQLIGLEGVGQTDLIKRVIAVGGQTVSCCDSRNRVLVDGKPLDEQYVYFAPGMGPPQQSPFAPVKLPAGSIWVMGDSRNNSVDSRAPGDGPVPVSQVVGRARWIVYPFSRIGVIGSHTAKAAQ